MVKGSKQEIVDDKTLQSREESCKSDMEDMYRKCGESARWYGMWVLNSHRYPAVLRRAHRVFFDRAPGRCIRVCTWRIGYNDIALASNLTILSCNTQLEVVSESLSKSLWSSKRLYPFSLREVVHCDDPSRHVLRVNGPRGESLLQILFVHLSTCVCSGIHFTIAIVSMTWDQ